MRSLLLAVLPLVGLAAAKDYQIRSDQDPVYHWYLQGYPGNASLAVLGPVNSSEYFNIDGTIQSVNTSLYLNIGSDSTSYKTLTFGAAANFDDWDLEGDTIATESSSSIGRVINFLACELDDTYWQVWLQTGSDEPASGNCSNYQSLHLPCLC